MSEQNVGTSVIYRDGNIILKALTTDGVRTEVDLRTLVRFFIAEELGYSPNATLSQRLSYLRNDGGASV